VSLVLWSRSAVVRTAAAIWNVGPGGLHDRIRNVRELFYHVSVTRCGWISRIYTQSRQPHRAQHVSDNISGKASEVFQKLRGFSIPYFLRSLWILCSWEMLSCLINSAFNVHALRERVHNNIAHFHHILLSMRIQIWSHCNAAIKLRSTMLNQSSGSRE